MFLDCCKARLVGSDRYVLACYRYIELNPIHARMTNDPALVELRGQSRSRSSWLKRGQVHLPG